ncbi:baculoviral IAP repeat-containing protein 7-B-like [Haliotis asinina]|uniref:baculoviral IAP repeat-containing protein 7-B-like n=1 Tax=Haliotis asinina TaxID=109174 RepID=UPI003531AA3C
MTRNGVPLEYLMVFEALRLTSFFGLDIAVSRIKLAKAGFYATGDGDETRCFSCGVRYKNWREGDRPDHVTHKHNCQHSHSSHRGNVPFAENPLPLTTDITSSRLWYPTSDYDLHDPQPEIHDAQPEIHPPYTAPSNGRPRPLTSSALGSWSGSDYHTPDYTQETDRLASFRGWPNESGPTPRQLAAAGFYYTGFQDKVRCFCCGVGLWKWDKEDEPWQEHVRFRPNCRFLAERYPADTSPQTGTNYHAPDYCRESDRLTSFQGWPSKRRPTPQQLATAGFYYTGVMDIVRCFSCGVILRKVDEEDDPRQEHARFRPNCSFLADTTPQVTGTSSNEMYPQRATAKRNTESQDKRESRLCKICLEDPASIIILPCGHVVVCDECASALERCPVCLKHILGTVRVYKTDVRSRQKRTDNK